MINQLYPLIVLLYKEIHRIIRIWRQTFIPPIITTSMYYLIFGTIFASRIGNIEGLEYVDFITPGLIMLSLIVNSFSNVASSFFLERFYNGINQLLMAPLNYSTILCGYVLGGVFRGMTSGLIVLIVAEWFTDIQIVHIGYTLMSLLFTSVLFAQAGLTNAILARSFDDLSIVPNFILTPLIYLGGVFFSINLLSPFWSQVAQFNPILYIVSTLRFGLLDHSNVNITYSFIGMFMGIIVFTFINLYLLKNSKELHS